MDLSPSLGHVRLTARPPLDHLGDRSLTMPRHHLLHHVEPTVNPALRYPDIRATVLASAASGLPPVVFARPLPFSCQTGLLLGCWTARWTTGLVRDGYAETRQKPRGLRLWGRSAAPTSTPAQYKVAKLETHQLFFNDHTYPHTMVAAQEELKHHDVVADVQPVADEKREIEDDPYTRQVVGHPDQDPDTIPTPEEMRTLRKVPAALPLVGLAMCLIEFAERASYYGSQGPFNNFLVSL